MLSRPGSGKIGFETRFRLYVEAQAGRAQQCLRYMTDFDEAMTCFGYV